MKKTIAIITLLFLTTTTTYADLVRVEFGGGAWMKKQKGDIEADKALYTGSDSLNQKNQTKGYAWILVKHPIPIVPNLRLEYTEMQSDGMANGTFKNFEAKKALSELKLKQYDIIPYYNILDNTGWVTLDLGVDIKILDTKYDIYANDILQGKQSKYNESKNVVLPMAYARVRVQIPATEIALETDVKYTEYSDNKAYDVRVKVDYTFHLTPLIQHGIEVGYRVQKFEVDKISNITTNIDYAGIYAGVMLRY